MRGDCLRDCAREIKVLFELEGVGSDLETDMFICHTTRADDTEEVPTTIVVHGKQGGVVFKKASKRVISIQNESFDSRAELGKACSH